MNIDYSELRDPFSGAILRNDQDYLKSESDECYPIVDKIPRFVERENYAHDFGFQWNEFRQTQLDSFTGVPISEERLRRCLNGESARINGKRVLEAGSGAGRFTEVLLKLGGIVHSFDYSSAVEANYKNNGGHKNLLLVQADIRNIPFAKSSYDYVICLGVLQHTPDPEQSIKCLWEMVRPGGRLVFDHYRPIRTTNWPPPIGPAAPLYRRIILKVPRSRRFAYVRSIVDFWFSIHWFLRDIPLAQKLLTRVSPLHFYYPSLKLKGKSAFYEWALLDTHDGTTDFYKHRRSKESLVATVKSLGAIEIRAVIGGNGTEVYCQKAW